MQRRTLSVMWQIRQFSWPCVVVLVLCAGPVVLPKVAVAEAKGWSWQNPSAPSSQPRGLWGERQRHLCRWLGRRHPALRRDDWSAMKRHGRLALWCVGKQRRRRLCSGQSQHDPALRWDDLESHGQRYARGAQWCLGSSGSDVFAVGRAAPSCTTTGQPERHGERHQRHLVAIWGSSGHDIFAVGTAARSSTTTGQPGAR